MKTCFIYGLAFLLSISAFSQNFEALSKYEFNEVESYKTEQDKVLECANYLFNNPSNKDELNRLTAIQYIMKWMEGTPAYTFEIGDKAMELTKGNSDLLGLYLAGMTKVVLENKGEALDSSQIHDKTESLLVSYCANSDNKMKPSKKIKKLIKNK
ncbi:hypothetical protein [Hyunsoonleella ulvae]|uniref:hypothetical protein n=1 Tax=Hyunsoonleella ulvae TaxID=2799948 RepID=UPI00193AB708|nr:hypothetical protein [Hyunsoonleella ulvae]